MHNYQKYEFASEYWEGKGPRGEEGREVEFSVTLRVEVVSLVAGMNADARLPRSRMAHVSCIIACKVREAAYSFFLTMVVLRRGGHTPTQSMTRPGSSAVVVTPEESEAGRLYDYHLSLLTSTASQHELVEVSTTPLFTMPFLEQAEAITS